MEPNADVVLECLKLTNSPGVRVRFYDSIGRAIVTVDAPNHGTTPDDARLATKKSGWDVDVYTAASLEQARRKAVREFACLNGVTVDLARALIEQGYLTFEDLSVIDPDTLAQLGGIDMQMVDAIIEQAESKALEMDT